MQENVYSSFIHNGTKLEATQISLISERKGKQTTLHPFNGVLRVHKKKHAIKSLKDMNQL